MNNCFVQRTGMSYYNDFLTNPKHYCKERGVKFEIVEMAPDEYIKACAELHGSSIIAEMLMIERSNLIEIKEKMETKGDFPLLLLDFNLNRQEGRHRAVAADILGLKIIPVMVVEPIEKGGFL